MNHAMERRRAERRLREMATLRERQETLLREAIRAEIRIHEHSNPLATELVLYEGIWDSIKGAATKAMEFGKEAAQEFKRGWAAVSKVVGEALASITSEIMEKAKAFMEQLKSMVLKLKDKASAFGEDKVQKFVDVLKPALGNLKTEGDALAKESESIASGEQVVKDLASKAEDMDDGSASARAEVKEGMRVASQVRLMTERSNRQVMTEGRKKLLKEGADPFSVFLLGWGGIMLIFKGLAALLRYIGGPTGTWTKKAAAFCQKVYDGMHHLEEAALDNISPDVVAATFYDFYIFCGFAPVKGDPGKKMTNRFGTEEFGEESAAYKKGKLVGKFGASRGTEAEELKGNDAFRVAIKVRMFQTMVIYMLGAALFTIAKTGVSLYYGAKAATKSAEIGVAAAPEIAAAAGEFGSAAGELGIAGAEVGAAAGALS